ncbi:MAG: hypothetical protein NC320_06610 [Clostridium sp.]|nr:hypothetical protein [Clostridium sp.]
MNGDQLKALNASLDPSMGKVTYAAIEDYGKFSNYNFDIKLENEADATLYKLTATIEMAGQENTVSLYCTDGEENPNPHSSKLTLMTLGPISITAGENVHGGLSSFVDDSKSGNVYMDQYTELSGSYRTGGSLVLYPSVSGTNTNSGVKVAIDSYNDYENGVSNKGVYIGRNLVMRSAKTLDLDFFENISSIKYKNLPHFYVGGSLKAWGSPEITIGSYEQPFITMMGSMVLGELTYRADTNYKYTMSMGNSKIYGDVYLYENFPESVITANANSGIYPFKPGIISDKPGYAGGNLYSLGTVNVIGSDGTLANNVVADKIVFWNTNTPDPDNPAKETTTNGSVVAKSADFQKSTATNPNWKFNKGLFTDPDNLNVYYTQWGSSKINDIEYVGGKYEYQSRESLSPAPILNEECSNHNFELNDPDSDTKICIEIPCKFDAEPIPENIEENGYKYEYKGSNTIKVQFNVSYDNEPDEPYIKHENNLNDFTYDVYVYNDETKETKYVSTYNGSFGENSFEVNFDSNSANLMFQVYFYPNKYKKIYNVYSENGMNYSTEIDPSSSEWKPEWNLQPWKDEKNFYTIENIKKEINVSKAYATVNINREKNTYVYVPPVMGNSEFLKQVNDKAFEWNSNVIEIKDIDKTVTITRETLADGTPVSLKITNSKDGSEQNFPHAYVDTSEYEAFLRAVVNTVTFPESMYYNDTELSEKFSSDILTIDNEAKEQNKIISDYAHSVANGDAGTGNQDWNGYNALQYPSIASYKVLTGYESAKGFVDTTSNQKYMEQINRDSAEWTYDNLELAEKFDWENKNVPIYCGTASGEGSYYKFLYSEYEAGKYSDFNVVNATVSKSAINPLKITDDDSCILTGVFNDAKIEIDPDGKDIYVGLYQCELRNTDIVVEDGSGKGNVYFFVPKNNVRYVRFNFGDTEELAGGWKYDTTGLTNEGTVQWKDDAGYMPYYSNTGHFSLYKSNILTRYYYGQLGSGKLDIDSSVHKPNIFIYLDSAQPDMEIYYDSSIISATIMGKTTTLYAANHLTPINCDVTYDGTDMGNMPMGIIGNAVFEYAHFDMAIPFFFAEGSNGNSASTPPDPSAPQSIQLTKLYYQAT